MLNVGKAIPTFLSKWPMLQALHCVAVQWWIQKVWRGGGEDNLQLRPHLSQMRTTKYMYIFMPFTRKKRLFEKIWANRPPFESAIVAVVGKLN